MFLPCCPVLEDLTIYGCVGESIHLNFNVSALELRKLRIRLDTEEGASLVDHNDYNLLVRAPKLENFGLEQTALSIVFWRIQSL